MNIVVQRRTSDNVLGVHRSQCCFFLRIKVWLRSRRAQPNIGPEIPVGISGCTVSGQRHLLQVCIWVRWIVTKYCSENRFLSYLKLVVSMMSSLSSTSRWQSFTCQLKENFRHAVSKGCLCCDFESIHSEAALPNTEISKSLLNVEPQLCLFLTWTFLSKSSRRQP